MLSQKILDRRTNVPTPHPHAHGKRVRGRRAAAAVAAAAAALAPAAASIAAVVSCVSAAAGGAAQHGCGRAARSLKGARLLQRRRLRAAARNPQRRLGRPGAHAALQGLKAFAEAERASRGGTRARCRRGAHDNSTAAASLEAAKFRRSSRRCRAERRR